MSRARLRGKVCGRSHLRLATIQLNDGTAITLNRGG